MYVFMYVWSGALLESDRETRKLKCNTNLGRNLSPPPPTTAPPKKKKQKKTDK